LEAILRPEHREHGEPQEPEQRRGEAIPAEALRLQMNEHDHGPAGDRYGKDQKCRPTEEVAHAVAAQSEHEAADRKCADTQPGLALRHSRYGRALRMLEKWENMLIFIKNTPRPYAWGSRNAIPELLGEQPTGEPQAELWLGTHPGSPASVAKATHDPHTLIDLVDSDPELYGVRGGPLPFLLKVLAIEAPLSLQVHPDIEQAREGFAREEAAGVPRDASGRNYGDPNHKPELLVALTPLSALSGFRPIAEARDDLRGLERRARALGDEAGAAALAHAV